jgi:hypothetical protein
VTLFTSPIQAIEKLVTISIKKRLKIKNQHKYMRIIFFFLPAVIGEVVVVVEALSSAEAALS